MNRRRSLLLPVLGALAACGVEDPAPLTGEYVRSHQVFVFHGSEPVQVRTEDRLRLEEAAAGLGFELSIVGSAGSACRAEGVAAARRGYFEFRPPAPDSEREARGCALRFSADDREIVVADVGGGCRKLYCEGGAALDRATFPRPP